MEISEAAKRIFRARGLVILAFLVTGLAAGFGVHKGLRNQNVYRVGASRPERERAPER